MLVKDADIRLGLEGTHLSHLTEELIVETQRVFQQRFHGSRESWLQNINRLPDIAVDRKDLLLDAVTVSCANNIDVIVREELTSCLQALHPWRKGPFNIFDVDIDSEWRSNLKWNRIAQQISSLEGKCVLDVGCGNGYYLWRMIGMGARLAFGIDPTELFLAQFAAVKKYMQSNKALVLPFKSEELASLFENHPGSQFDTVFSMGIYYHRKNPSEHLTELFQFLKPGGELILETLTIDRQYSALTNGQLVPQGRYAQMRNVWSIPTPELLSEQLSQIGFDHIQILDITPTTIEEQRSTEWMRYDSLTNFLDPNDSSLTIEGYPAPVRICIRAKRP